MKNSISTKTLQTLKNGLVAFLQEEYPGAVPNPCLNDLYEKTVEKLVLALLRSNEFQISAESFRPEEDCFKKLTSMSSILGSMGIEDIAQCYEYLSGLSLHAESDGKLTFRTYESRRRNRGLFYTPKEIARNIVSLSLDVLQTADRTILSRIKVLDPAVGAGVFLTEALDEISLRLGRLFTKDSTSLFHIAARLYGTDIDRVAIHITKAALGEQLEGKNLECPVHFENIRVGNSLIGSDGMYGKTIQKLKLEEINSCLGFHSCSGKIIPTSWAKKRGTFNWFLEFPDVFSRDNPGFDLIIGNPPYEVLSAKESGIPDLNIDIKYFRSEYKTCSGKINIYRLMMERSVNLLRTGGVLGFIVPATFLADSTALRLREKILRECEITDLEIIPEKAKVFSGVTQAFAIIIARKGKSSTSLRPTMWQGTNTNSHGIESQISISELAKMGRRIPVVRSETEICLLKHLISFPTMASSSADGPNIRVHQGEINLTTHKDFITDQYTGIRLVRGEHIQPFRIKHPSQLCNRLDWVKPEIFECPNRRQICKIRGSSQVGGRVALARVVNLDSRTRLKAAWVDNGSFLGDMTNYMDQTVISTNFTLGLLNSKILNWRFKITSANNYVSASELETLPVPYQRLAFYSPEKMTNESDKTKELTTGSIKNIHNAAAKVDNIYNELTGEHRQVYFLVSAIEAVVSLLIETDHIGKQETSSHHRLTLMLDALVIKLYMADIFINIFNEEC